MKVKCLNLGVLFTNCYVVISENKNAVVIDIGGNSETLLEYLEKNNITLKKILLTHGHFDHIGGVEEIHKATGAEIYIHKLDVPKLSSVTENLGVNFGITNFIPIKEYTEIADGDIIKLDELEFKVMHTSGHTEGGVCYITDDAIFSGDTLFKGSCGRTDFADGDIAKMRISLKKLKDLNGNYKVYPGHDFDTNLDYERQNNPYMVNL